MLPTQLTADAFAAYPPEARHLCVDHLPLLRQLPLAFLPLLLRELIVYDWKFPVERRDFEAQLAYLRAQLPAELVAVMAPFSGLRLTPKLQSSDWVNNPGRFSEELTAELWATHQIDGFREAAIDYVGKFDAAKPKERPVVPRLGIVLIGQGVTANDYPLFQKLRHQGVYFRNVAPESGRSAIFEAVARRAAAHPTPFDHWYIDGGDADPLGANRLTCVSYNALGPVRDALMRKFERIMQRGGGGPEVLRTQLAQMRPEDAGMRGTGDAAVLNRFQLSLLTEGSGTQLYSTTFVQWSAREALRRAQPSTLLAHYVPRRREQSMNELISGVKDLPGVDPQGSLIDADMGAYYTWINSQRLSGADRAGFLVWFEAGREAVAIGPNLPRDAQQSRPTNIPAILSQLA
jgi:hypothetical protein